MQYAISCRQTTEVLNKADIFIVPWKDRKGIVKFGKDYPNKKIILLLEDESDSKEIEKYNILCHNQLICRVLTPAQLIMCQENDFKFYVGMPATNFQQAQAAKEAGAEFLYISAPLTHNLEAVKALGLEVAVTLNSVNDFFPYVEDNVGGAWFRPEDFDYYSKYIDIGFFAYNELKQEKAYFDVYSNLKFWDADIKDLIIGLNASAKNRMIPPEFAERRGKCQQKCMQNRDLCHYCHTILSLANPDLFKNKNITIKENE